MLAIIASSRGTLDGPNHIFVQEPPDGNTPLAGLINVNGTLYGTTYHGGKTSSSHNIDGYGTLFKINPAGAESVIHSTYFGSGYGTVFAISRL